MTLVKAMADFRDIDPGENPRHYALVAMRKALCTIQDSSAKKKMEKDDVTPVNTSDLDGLEQWTRTAPNFTTSPQGEAFGEQLREVIRLARVGLEAENPISTPSS